MMPIAEWLREIAVWSPNCHYSTLEERIPLYVELLKGRFPPEAFSQDTVRLVAAAWETFPPYAVIHRTLSAAGHVPDA